MIIRRQYRLRYVCYPWYLLSNICVPFYTLKNIHGYIGLVSMYWQFLTCDMRLKSKNKMFKQKNFYCTEKVNFKY